MADSLHPLNEVLGNLANNLATAADHAERLARTRGQSGAMDLSRLDGPSIDRLVQQILMHARMRPGT